MTASTDVSALLMRLQAQEQEQREITRLLRVTLDDLSASVEAARQLRAELLTLVTVADTTPVSSTALVVSELGCCGRLEVTR